MLKSFSIGHTAKGKVWWQRWMVDGTADKGSADTITAALGAVGVAVPSAGDGEIAELCAVKVTLGYAQSAIADLNKNLAARESDLETVRAELARTNEEMCRLGLFTAPSADCDEWRARAVDAGKDVADLRVKLANAQADEKKAVAEAVMAYSATAALQAENDTLKADLSALRKQVGADRLERWGVANG